MSGINKLRRRYSGVMFSLIPSRLAYAGQVVKEFDRELIALHVRGELPAAALASYGLSFSRGSHGFRMESLPVWWMTPYGIVLTCSRDTHSYITTVAAIGFRVRCGVLRIEQVFGIGACSADLEPLRWEKLLYSAAILFAHCSGLRRVESVIAERNTYYPNEKNIEDMYSGRSNVEVDRLKQKLRHLYNEVPQRCGFTLDSRRGVYVYQLD